MPRPWICGFIGSRVGRLNGSFFFLVAGDNKLLGPLDETSCWCILQKCDTRVLGTSQETFGVEEGKTQDEQSSCKDMLHLEFTPSSQESSAPVCMSGAWMTSRSVWQPLTHKNYAMVLTQMSPGVAVESQRFNDRTE